MAGWHRERGFNECEQGERCESYRSRYASDPEPAARGVLTYRYSAGLWRGPHKAEPSPSGRGDDGAITLTSALPGDRRLQADMFT